MLRSFLIALLSLILVFGCSKDEISEDPDATELFYYESAQDSLRASNYAGAIQKLQMLEFFFGLPTLLTHTSHKRVAIYY